MSFGLPLMMMQKQIRMTMLVAGLSRLSCKKGKAVMLIGDTDIARLMVYVHQGSVAQGGNWAPTYAMCCRNHPGECCDGTTGCFKCGQDGNFMKDRTQSSSVAPPNRAAPRRATSGTGRRVNCLYAITSR
ncbi:uncharacterized protein LOC125863758 [Solanum stenotomum]|uniref:uncharacterized protein LOC125863758 n=1 Tax=Solanum stenotomum TaxID=172797 RepID=UPI0020D12173|nr:uncharacterized protein LOC125863758 [Solanum stenotomum]